MTLRNRVRLMLAPLVVLVLMVGVAGVWLLNDLGHRSDAILRENYDSIRLMSKLDDKLNSADQLALQVSARHVTDEAAARKQFRQVMGDARELCAQERRNITVSGEDEAAAKLTAKVEELGRCGEQLFELPSRDRWGFYAREDAESFQAAWFDARVSARFVLLLNEGAMEDADRAARATARRSSWVLGGATAVALLLAVATSYGLRRTVLRPVEDLTRSAKAVGDGRFDQMVTSNTRDEIGELVGAFNRMTAQLRDLKQTHATRLLRAQQASQAAIDSFPDPVLVVDPDRRVEMANPAARRVLGVVPGGDATGPPWEAPERLRGPLAAVLSNQQPFFTQSFDEAVTYRIGNEDRIYLPQVLPVRDPYGNTLGAAVVLNDVTRFRLLDEFKSDLVATASHELKTPLAGLRLAVHLLLEETVGPLTDKQTELLVDARENTERLVRIVDHLLSLARLEQGREPIHLRPEDPVKMIRDAAERIQPRLSGKRLTVDVESGVTLPPLAADAQRLGHALDNLLVNADMYTGTGGEITLSARAVAPGQVELVVRDTGIGIAPEHLPHVFDKFFRIPGQTRGQGTGLGLAIVKEVVSAHGGTITCESEPGRGTTFRILLPEWAQ